MNLNASTIRTLFRTEMRMVLRDRRTIITSIILPIVIMPLMLFSTSWTQKKREQTLRETVYHYAITGSNAASVRALVTATRERLASDGKAKGKTRFRFDEVTQEDAIAALARAKLHIVLEAIPTNTVPATNAVASKQKEKPGNTPKNAKPDTDHDKSSEGSLEMQTGAPVVRIVYRADRDDSTVGMQRMRDALRETCRAKRTALLLARGFPVPLDKVATVSEVNVASKGQVAGLTLGKMITLFLLMFIMSSGAVVATDLIAGEKERGTLETLLTTAAGRTEIVTAKHLVILAVALIVTLIQAANLLVYVGFKLIPVSAGFAAAVPPSVAALLFLIFLPMAALAASALLLTSAYAKSYKEAQLYFLPVVLLGLIPALAPMLPGLPLRSAIVLVPIANIAVSAKEILVGSFDWPMIAISWLVTLAAAVWTTRLSVRLLSAERLITVTDRDADEFVGGPALFGRHVLRWFAVLWAVLLIVNNYIGTADIRAQLAVNLVLIFFGASCLMIWRYRLNPRTTLALRTPKPAVWLAVLLGVPSGLLTGIGLFRLANLVFPVPKEITEGFSQAVLPEGMPVAHLVLFLCVMPGVFEEIAFRGLLLHGLHRRLRPATLAVVVGLIFGIFHFALFRLAPTAFLGTLLAAITLLTGSIFPAMLWHVLSNAAALAASMLQIPMDELPPVCYGIGVIGLATTFWILWRNRTPYPGLRPWRQKRRLP